MMIKWTYPVLYLADAMSGVSEWFYLRSRADRQVKFGTNLRCHVQIMLLFFTTQET